MSCVLPNKNALESGVSAGADSLAQLCMELDEGLHALAQPLTILRGALDVLTMRGAVPPESSRYLEMSHTQVEHLCNLLSGLRNLLDAAQSEPKYTENCLWNLLVTVLENRQAESRNSTRRIAVAKPDCDFRMMADPVQTEQALHAALNAAEAQSQSPGDICMDISRRDGFANLNLSCTRSKGEKLTAINRLHLLVAEANVRKQHGLYEFSEYPFQISIKFPLLDEEERITEVVNRRTTVHES
jgi:hypothetical protein